MDLAGKEKYQLSELPLNVVGKYLTIKLSFILNLNSNFILKALIWGRGSSSPLYISKIGFTYRLGSLVLRISSHNGFEYLVMDGAPPMDQLLLPMLKASLLYSFLYSIFLRLALVVSSKLLTMERNWASSMFEILEMKD